MGALEPALGFIVLVFLLVISVGVPSDGVFWPVVDFKYPLVELFVDVR